MENFYAEGKVDKEHYGEGCLVAANKPSQVAPQPVILKPALTTQSVMSAPVWQPAEELVKTRRILNLFDEKPSLWQLFKQCYPVFYVLLYILWGSVNQHLLSLQAVDCVPIVMESADLDQRGLPKESKRT